MSALSVDQIGILSLLANGIIPSDEKDDGALEVKAADLIAERIEQGIQAKVYIEGIDMASRLCWDQFSCTVFELNTDQVYELLLLLKSHHPGFFKALRGDVSYLYLNDPGVWNRIGFPGPSAPLGGYPDFDQPQVVKKGQEQ